MVVLFWATDGGSKTAKVGTTTKNVWVGGWFSEAREAWEGTKSGVSVFVPGLSSTQHGGHDFDFDIWCRVTDFSRLERSHLKNGHSPCPSGRLHRVILSPSGKSTQNRENGFV